MIKLQLKSKGEEFIFPMMELMGPAVRCLLRLSPLTLLLLLFLFELTLPSPFLHLSLSHSYKIHQHYRTNVRRQKLLKPPACKYSPTCGCDTPWTARTRC